MKSLYDLSWKVSEEEYRADKALSYSLISRYNREGFNNLSHLFDKIDTPSLTFGSVVDTLITEPDNFYNKYVIAEFPNITDSLIQIAQKLFVAYHEVYKRVSEIPEDILSEVGVECGYYTAQRYENTRVKNIKENCENYYDLLYLSIGKTLISTSIYQDARNCVEALFNSEATKYYFSKNDSDKSTERFYQLKFKGEYNNIPLKCMADLILVNSKDKTIQPCDLKTTGKNEWDFWDSFVHWGYYIQAQLYWELIQQTISKDPDYKDYKLLNYKFIVINRNNLKPLVWNYSDTKAIVDCIYGKNNNIICKNWRNIILDLWYYINSNSEYPIDIHYNNMQSNDIVQFLNKD